MPANETTDVYSFGVLLWEMLTGDEPPRFALLAPEKQRVCIPSSCPEYFANLILDCWKAAPEQRPTFSAIVERIQQMPSFPEQTAQVDQVSLQSDLRKSESILFEHLHVLQFDRLTIEDDILKAFSDFDSRL